MKTEIRPKYSRSAPKSAPKSIYAHAFPRIFIGQKSSVNSGTHPNVRDAVSATDCPERARIAQGCLERAWGPSFPGWTFRLTVSLTHLSAQRVIADTRQPPSGLLELLRFSDISPLCGPFTECVICDKQSSTHMYAGANPIQIIYGRKPSEHCMYVCSNSNNYGIYIVSVLLINRYVN